MNDDKRTPDYETTRVVYRRQPDGSWKCDETGESLTNEQMYKRGIGTWERVVPPDADAGVAEK